MEEAVESIAKDTATKKDEVKLTSFLETLPEVIPKVNATKVKEVDHLLDNVSTKKHGEEVQSFL